MPQYYSMIGSVGKHRVVCCDQWIVVGMFTIQSWGEMTRNSVKLRLHSLTIYCQRKPAVQDWTLYTRHVILVWPSEERIVDLTVNEAVISMVTKEERLLKIHNLKMNTLDSHCDSVDLNQFSGNVWGGENETTSSPTYRKWPTGNAIIAVSQQLRINIYHPIYNNTVLTNRWNECAGNEDSFTLVCNMSLTQKPDAVTDLTLGFLSYV